MIDGHLSSMFFYARFTVDARTFSTTGSHRSCGDLHRIPFPTSSSLIIPYADCRRGRTGGRRSEEQDTTKDARIQDVSILFYSYPAPTYFHPKCGKFQGLGLAAALGTSPVGNKDFSRLFNGDAVSHDIYPKWEPIFKLMHDFNQSRVVALCGCVHCYLGRIISDDDSDDLAVASQLQKARAVWSRLGALLRSDGAEPEVMGKFWKTITQAILLFGSEMWTISQRSLRRLDRFQARCARYMARQHIRQFPDGSWEHPATAEVLDKCKMFSIDHYIKVRRCTLFKHYADEHSSLFGDCLGLEIDGRDHNLFWWNLEHS